MRPSHLFLYELSYNKLYKLLEILIQQDDTLITQVVGFFNLEYKERQPRYMLRRLRGGVWQRLRVGVGELSTFDVI